jgi:type IV pilus assembly protein PilM
VLPVAVHESVLDYRVLEERPNEAGEPSKRILLVVAPRDQVEPYTEVAKLAGIGLAGLDLEALSLLRAFVDPKPFAVRAVDDTATVVVSIGHESTTLLVSGGGSCEFTRVFDWGGGTLQEAIAKELDVHPAEAATILRHLSLSGPGRLYDTLDEAARSKAIEAVRLRLTPFARELVSSLQFYQTQPDSLGIGEIVITGGTSHLEGLGDVLHQMIGVSVRVGDPLARVFLSCEIEPAIEATLNSMSVAIGLAIEDEPMRSVNLLPKDAQSSTRKRPSLIAVALPAAALVPIAALGFMFVSAHGKVGDGQNRLNEVQAQIDALPQPKRPVIDSALQGSQVERAKAVASVLGARVPWDAVLRDVSRVLPENVWLTMLQAQVSATGGVPVAATTPTVTSTPTGAQIDGYTYAQTDVARLLARLATLPTLTNVTLTSSKVEAKGAKSIVHFQIAADLNTGGS